MVILKDYESVSFFIEFEFVYRNHLGLCFKPASEQNNANHFFGQRKRQLGRHNYNTNLSETVTILRIALFIDAYIGKKWKLEHQFSNQINR